MSCIKYSPSKCSNCTCDYKTCS